MSIELEKYDLREASDILDKLLQNTKETPENIKENQSGGLTNINNLFHFLLLDKINMKKEIKDKLIKVYEILSSKSLGTSNLEIVPSSGPALESKILPEQVPETKPYEKTLH